MCFLDVKMFFFYIRLYVLSMYSFGQYQSRQFDFQLLLFLSESSFFQLLLSCACKLNYIILQRLYYLPDLLYVCNNEIYVCTKKSQPFKSFLNTTTYLLYYYVCNTFRVLFVLIYKEITTEKKEYH